jgi:hypothetical protein
MFIKQNLCYFFNVNSIKGIILNQKIKCKFIIGKHSSLINNLKEDIYILSRFME